MIRWPKPGENVVFQEEGGKVKGICNGDPLELDGVKMYLPVYVREGDKCIMVHGENIIEWPED